MATTQHTQLGTAHDQTAQHKPWRDNIEALTMAIVLALLLKAFIIEAYKIPTGSMQPTLMGMSGGPGVPADLRVSDRILVDKFSPYLSDPERWQVAVFKYPLDRSKNFVKRICGMPGELFRIENGDLWRRDDASQEWQIPRRPARVMQDIWKNLDLEDVEGRVWVTTSGGDGWNLAGRDIEARGDGRARYGLQDAPILDRYYHGYPDSLRKQLNTLHPRDTNLRVGDLRLVGKVNALAGSTAVHFEISEGTAIYSFQLPGPAAEAGAKPTIEIRSTESDGPTRTVQGEPYALRAGKAVSFAVENLDDRVRFEVDGELLAESDVAPAPYPDARIHIESRGAGADFTDLMVQRDIFYTGSTKESVYEIPQGHYMMLGDNTQDSSDSREWTFARYELDGETVLRGNFRQTQNPYFDGTVTWLEDQFGERHALAVEGTPRMGALPHGLEVFKARMLTPETSPFVPRELITGRAFAVFWPVNPFKDLYRFKWIR